jgi:uncharacterized protein (DUF1778 family)
MSRLSIEVSSEQHQKIKALAALQGQSIKDYILNKILHHNDLSDEAAMGELEKLLLERIRQSKKSSPSLKSIQEITERVISKQNS